MHTPAPWTVKVNDVEQTLCVRAESEYRTVCVVCDAGTEADAEAFADAALIAAAPELLAALREAMATGLKADIATIERLAAIAAKAEGRS